MRGIKYPLYLYETLERNCPKCGSTIKYSRIGDKIKGYKNKTECKKCSFNKGKFIKGQKTTNTKPIYQCWLEKFGKEEADKRMDIFRKKQSIIKKRNMVK